MGTTSRTAVAPDCAWAGEEQEAGARTGMCRVCCPGGPRGGYRVADQSGSSLPCERVHSDEGCPLSNVAIIAASQGHTKILQWLNGEGLLSMDPMICTGAL